MLVLSKFNIITEINRARTHMLKPAGAVTARSARSTGDAMTARAAETRAKIEGMNIMAMIGLLANDGLEASEVPTWQKLPSFYTIRAVLADVVDRFGQRLLTGSGRRCPAYILGRGMSRASLDI